jgi:hypothetical protein
MMNAIETADIFRGAYLLCCGAHVADAIVKRNQVRFVIEGEGVIEHDEHYRMGRALVNPIALRETLNLLRDLVFERLRMEKTPHGAHPARSDRTAQSHR